MSDTVLNSAMRRAIVLAQKGIPEVAPNPAVGAVLVKSNQIVAEGWHECFGGPHAEVNCLNDAKLKGIDPAECIMVVTLEPCNHRGKTPPCTQAIIDAKIKHVIIGFNDPNSKASGGAGFLKAHGVKVENGPYPDECRDLIADFIFWQSGSLPYTTLKVASTLDGFIATRSGKSRWITGEAARERVHMLRAENQIVLVGGGTLFADNPLLSVRFDDFGEIVPVNLTQIPGNCPQDRWLDMERPYSFVQPLAVVVSGRKLDTNNLPRLIVERGNHTVFLTGKGSELARQADFLKGFGVRIFEFEPGEKGEFRETTLREMFIFLREEMNVWRILSEGGSRFGLALLRAGLVNKLELHMAPCIMADKQAINVFDGLTPDTLEQVRNTLPLKLLRVGKLGSDVIMQFESGI